jgi:hypothetical protein
MVDMKRFIQVSCQLKWMHDKNESFHVNHSKGDFTLEIINGFPCPTGLLRQKLSGVMTYKTCFYSGASKTDQDRAATERQLNELLVYIDTKIHGQKEDTRFLKDGKLPKTIVVMHSANKAMTDDHILAIDAIRLRYKL